MDERLEKYKQKTVSIADIIMLNYNKNDWVLAIAYESNKLAFRGCLGADGDGDVQFFRDQAPECPGCIMRKMELTLYEYLRSCNKQSVLDRLKAEDIYHAPNIACQMKQFSEWRDMYALKRLEGKTVYDFMAPSLNQFLLSSLTQIGPIYQHTYL